MLKKILSVFVLGLLFCAGVSAQSSNAEYKVKNALIGFGCGSREQGDLESAKWLLISDVSGLSLMTIGGVGLVLTNLAYDYFKVTCGKVSTADFWINGSILGVGTAVFLAGRIFGIILPDKFAITENADLKLDSYGGQIVMGLNFRL